MPRIGVTITKSVLFREVQQEFHNTYHYEILAAVLVPSAAIVDEIEAKERDLHSNDVNFLRARVWTAGGTEAQNQMIHQENLTGVGVQSANGTMDRERAVLVRWPAGVDILGRPVYLRKFYHSCGNCAGQNVGSTGILQNTTPLNLAQRDAIASSVDGITEVGVASDSWRLCSPRGRHAQAGPQVHRWLEHHQLGDMWR